MAVADSTDDVFVTVTVPAGCASRFYREVLDEVSMAAENVMEGVEQLRSRDALDRLAEDDLPRMREADELFAQVAGHEGRDDLAAAVRAPRSVLASLVRSCVTGVAEDITGGAEFGWTSEKMRKLAGELATWLDLFDTAGLSTVQGREGAV